LLFCSFSESFICEVESEELSLNWLPWEVLEAVFCQLPLVELFTGCRLVCKRWNDIIMREKVLFTYIGTRISFRKYHKRRQKQS